MNYSVDFFVKAVSKHVLPNYTQKLLNLIIAFLKINKNSKVTKYSIRKLSFFHRTKNFENYNLQLKKICQQIKTKYSFYDLMAQNIHSLLDYIKTELFIKLTEDNYNNYSHTIKLILRAHSVKAYMSRLLVIANRNKLDYLLLRHYCIQDTHVSIHYREISEILEKYKPGYLCDEK